jgi:hypothetical protein
MKRAYYSSSLSDFLTKQPNEIVGEILRNSEFSVEENQRNAWFSEIQILKQIPKSINGKILFEFSIPRMGKRIDTVIVANSIIFVIEFKIGEKHFAQADIDQVWDYALDLKYFHETSKEKLLIPILVASESNISLTAIPFSKNLDNVFEPIKASPPILYSIIENCLLLEEQQKYSSDDSWETGAYKPTPTIIEAAMALYNGHSVDEISRNDAGATNLSLTSKAISEIINISKTNHEKSICFVTGVPGAGKTLVGLNIATKYIDKEQDLFSVFLSGNGPLVAILREALARNRVLHEKESGRKISLSQAHRQVKSFIQNVHNFRDDCLINKDIPPIEHVAIFDEAQRAWNVEQTSSFMKRKKGILSFSQSEPEFLISCLDRHKDWAVIVCLVGGGQEINTGEAGISAWLDAINGHFTNWQMYISPKLTDSEYGEINTSTFSNRSHLSSMNEDLHLATSLRSFRSENVSLLVKQILDLNIPEAKDTLQNINKSYPIFLTRSLISAKEWIKKQARGSERFGMIVSSQALRLKPFAIDVKSTIDPIHWFLDSKDDVRSSFYLEDVATEFQIQGLELDWTCVIWDGDFRYAGDHWDCHSFCGNKWNRIRKAEKQTYLKNAYRVLLTRARQGMVIVVPQGDEKDPTRDPGFYDATFDYLVKIGFSII